MQGVNIVNKCITISFIVISLLFFSGMVNAEEFSHSGIRTQTPEQIIPAGEQVDITINISADTDISYLRFGDQFPSGAKVVGYEVVNIDEEYVDVSISQNKIITLITNSNLEHPKRSYELRYTLQVPETAPHGNYNIQGLYAINDMESNASITGDNSVFVIESSNVYYEENNTCEGKRGNMIINTYPCHVQDVDSKNITQYINFTWNGISSQDIDMIFAYDKALISGKVYILLENGTWKDITDNFQYIGQATNLGVTWRMYLINSQTFLSGKTYKTKWIYTPKDEVGKWRIFGKFNEDSLKDAITNNHYIYLDPWWSNDWSKKQKITIEEQAMYMDLIDYPIIISSFDCNGYCQNEGQDIRIVNETSKTEIPFGLKKNNDGTFDIAFRINLANGSTNQNLAIYYGNPYAQATNVSFNSMKWDFFDDFNVDGDEPDRNNWYIEYCNGGDIDVVNGEMILKVDGSGINPVVWANNTGIGTHYGFISEVRSKFEDGNLQHSQGIRSDGNIGCSEGAWQMSAIGEQYNDTTIYYRSVYNNSGSRQITDHLSQVDDISDGTYRTFEWKLNQSGYGWWYRDDVLKEEAQTGIDPRINGNIYTDEEWGYFAIPHSRLTSYNDMYIDYVAIRKFVDPEPAITLKAETIVQNRPYKSIIRINGASDGNIQVKLVIPYMNGMATDFHDLLFTDSCIPNDAKILYAWNESQSNGNNVTVWVNVTDDREICMWYGNSSVAPSWNKSKTFFYAEDFETLDNGDISGRYGWTGSGNTFYVGNYAETYQGSKSLYTLSSVPQREITRTNPIPFQKGVTYTTYVSTNASSYFLVNSFGKAGTGALWFGRYRQNGETTYPLNFQMASSHDFSRKPVSGVWYKMNITYHNETWATACWSNSTWSECVTDTSYKGRNGLPDWIQYNVTDFATSNAGVFIDLITVGRYSTTPYTYEIQNYSAQDNSWWDGLDEDNYTMVLWKFDDDLGVTAKDQTGNWDGTYKDIGEPNIIGGFVGNSQKAVEFDGADDYITHPTLLDTFPPDGTIEMVIRLNEDFNENSSDYQTLVYKRNKDGGNYRIFYVSFRSSDDPNYAGKLCYFIVLPWSNVICTPQNSWEADRPYHLAFTWGSRGMELWVDGILVNSSSSTAYPPSGTYSDFLLGKGQYAQFNGQIDEFRISTIQRTYTKPPSDVTLNNSYDYDAYTIALWHFDENNGTFVNDSMDSWDLSKKSNNEPLWNDTDQKFGDSSLLFDGVDDYITNPSIFDNIPSNGTFEFWWKPDKTYNSSVDDFNTFLYKKNKNSPLNKMVVLWRGSDSEPYMRGKIQFLLQTDDSTIYRVTSTTNEFLAGVWYHIATTWGSDGMEIYVNGVLENSTSYTGIISDADGTKSDLFIGSNETGEEAVGGIIDEVRISTIQRDFEPLIKSITFGSISINSPIDPIENTSIQVEGYVNVTNASASFDSSNCSVYYPNNSIKTWGFGINTYLGSNNNEINCSFVMQYFEPNGTYTLNITVNLTDGNTDSTYTTFVYNSLSAFALNTTTLDYGTLQIDNNATRMFKATNTGNQNLNLEINGLDLTSAGDSIDVSNMKFDDDSDLSDATTMSSSFQSFTSLQLTQSKIGYINLYIPFGSLPELYSGSITIRSI